MWLYSELLCPGMLTSTHPPAPIDLHVGLDVYVCVRAGWMWASPPVVGVTDGGAIKPAHLFSWMWKDRKGEDSLDVCSSLIH